MCFFLNSLNEIEAAKLVYSFYHEFLFQLLLNALTKKRVLSSKKYILSPKKTNEEVKNRHLCIRKNERPKIQIHKKSNPRSKNLIIKNPNPDERLKNLSNPKTELSPKNQIIQIPKRQTTFAIANARNPKIKIY